MATKVKLHKPAEKITLAVPAVKSHPKANMRILVADDEVPLAKALQMKLTSVGYIVDVAADGQEALELIAKNAYDLIMLDLMMPRVDGFGVLAELKDKQNKTPVIVLSNLGQDVDKAKATQMGAVAYLIKSNTALSEIVDFTQKLLNHEPTEPGHPEPAA